MAKIHYLLKGQEATVEVEGGETLFDELSEKGVIWPHGCLAGACGVCRTEVLEGADQLSPPSAIEADTIARIREDLDPAKKLIPLRLACRAKVRGNVSIKVFGK